LPSFDGVAWMLHLVGSQATAPIQQHQYETVIADTSDIDEPAAIFSFTAQSSTSNFGRATSTGILRSHRPPKTTTAWEPLHALWA